MEQLTQTYALLCDGQVTYVARKNKGISTIVAAVFMVAMIILGINVLTFGLSMQNRFGQDLTERTIIDSERIGEKIEPRDVRIDNDKFNMTVANTSSLPIRLVSMWVTNTTDTNGWHQNYDNVDKLINPGDSLTNLGQGLSLVAKNSDSYKINLVTERGSLAYFQILSPKDKAIKMSLFTVPRSIMTGQNVTILFGVTNNLTDGSLVQSVTPQIDWTDTEIPGGSIDATATLIEGPTPATEQSLTLAETAFFKWVYKITGDEGDLIEFNATIADAKQGNYITEEIELASIEVSQSAVEAGFSKVAGTITIDYQSLRYDQDDDVPNMEWKYGFSLVKGEETIWKINMTNNNSTHSFYADEETMLVAYPTFSTNNKAFYIVDLASPDANIVDAYCPSNYCLKIAPEQTKIVYFGATAAGGNDEQSMVAQADVNRINIILFGKLCDESGPGCPSSGVDYAQQIPFVAIETHI